MALLDEGKLRYVLGQASVGPSLDKEHSAMTDIKTDHRKADGAIAR